METIVHIVTYVSIVVFILAIAFRLRRIRHFPVHLRWEIYPVPHEGKRSKHGGSRLEDTDWWDKSHTPDRWSELKFMLPEMVFIKALFENNRKLWYRSFPFHFGLYLLTGVVLLLFVGALLELGGIDLNASSNMVAGWLVGVTTGLGLAGLVLTIVGAAGLLVMRFTDDDLKPYTNFSHVFNLFFIMAGCLLLFSAWLAGDRQFSLLRGYLASLLTFDVSAPTGSVWISASVVTLSLLIAYIPTTHMSHFFVKWFTWHKIRWDDEPNVKGGRIEVLIQNALQDPVSWSADHVKADGKKSWADIATEEIEP
jgi:nitrate reductase gamma subunit